MMSNCLVLLDFDGVIGDTIIETWEISRSAFFDTDEIVISDDMNSLFCELRGLVGPPEHFKSLHHMLAEVQHSGIVPDYEKACALFTDTIAQISSADFETYRRVFFEKRIALQKHKEEWLALNPMTEYARFLVGKSLDNYCVITTKNESAAAMLLAHYGIDIPIIYGNESFQKSGTKGALIEEIMALNGAFDRAIFVDDMEKHLDSVSHPKVECYFANWGYGRSVKYKNFDRDYWHVKTPSIKQRKLGDENGA